MSYLSRFKLQLAADYVFQSGIIAYPTEAVFGLGCDPLNEQAVLRLLALKQRPIAKGLILIASQIKQLQPYICANSSMLKKAEETWPGPVTWVFPAQSWVPEWLTGQHQTIAVRLSAHPLVIKLCDQVRTALVSTSANPKGKSPAISALEIRKYFSQQSIHIVNGKVGGLKQTTPILDASNGHCFR
jgi:L-threonylcarbamoyladenylate synthase